MTPKPRTLPLILAAAYRSILATPPALTVVDFDAEEQS
jgi:hypothetical protein